MEGSYVLTNFPHKADVIVQVLCAFCEKRAARRAFTELLYLSKMKKKGAVLIVCGCFVNVVGKEFFSDLEFVDYAIKESHNMSSEILEVLKLQYTDEYYIDKYDTAFGIEIVNGCQKKHGWCTFCKQNYLKYPVKSRPLDEVLKIAQQVTSNSNVQTILLAGLNICNYGIDFGDRKPKLHKLIEGLSGIPTVKRIWLNNLTFESMYEELNCEIEKNPKISCIELPMQSGSDSMLKIMNTGSTVAEIQSLLDRFSKSGKRMKSTVVVSHPGETREFLQETIDFIVKNNLWYVIISPYQNSEGTPSFLMEQLDEEEYDYHYKQLSDAVMELKQKFLNDLVGTKLEGTLADGDFDEKNDVVYVYVDASDFVGRIIVKIPNFSSSSYKPLFDKVEIGERVRTKIVKVADYENVALIGADLEVI